MGLGRRRRNTVCPATTSIGWHLEGSERRSVRSFAQDYGPANNASTTSRMTGGQTALPTNLIFWRFDSSHR